MQGGRGGGNFFGFDPFADFGGFGAMRGHQSLISSVFGGRDPFDDPFFTQPFGSQFGSMFEPGFFGPSASPFTGAGPSAFLEAQEPQQNKRRGPVIEELNSDDEKTEEGGFTKKQEHPRKQSRLDKDKQPYVEVPDDGPDEGRNMHIQYRNERNPPQTQSHCFTFQSSSVSYGGADGAYYTKSMSSRRGNDGVSFEEFREADSTTGQANHRVSRGLYNKGHTLSRKLNPDGRVDATQTLHNLNEDELTGFERAWEGSAGKHLPGWRQRLQEGNNMDNFDPSTNGQTNRGGWALPSTQLPECHGINNSNMAGVTDVTHMQRTGRRVADRASRGRNRS